MNKYDKKTIHNDKIANGEEFLKCISEENHELFKHALLDGIDLKIRSIEDNIRNIGMQPQSRYYKIRMNRLFRECVGGSFLPFPEEDDFISEE